MSQNTYKAFDQLSEVIEKNNPIFDIICAPKDTSLFLIHSQETQRVRLYQFDNITIVKEDHEERGTESRRIGGSPHCTYRKFPFGSNWTFYYVLENNNLVSDKRKVKKLIKQTTGVYLPKLNTIEEKSDLHLRLGFDRIVTEISRDEKPDLFDFVWRDKRPDKEELGRESYQAKEELESLQKEFGFTSWEQFISHINLLREKASEASKDYEKELEEGRQRFLKEELARKLRLKV